MTKPDYCTSTRCNSFGTHCKRCSHAVYTGREFTMVGKYSFVISWEFEPYYGYTFKGGNFRSRGRQPGPKNKIWQTVTKWELSRGLITQKRYDAFVEAIDGN